MINKYGCIRMVFFLSCVLNWGGADAFLPTRRQRLQSFVWNNGSKEITQRITSWKPSLKARQEHQENISLDIQPKGKRQEEPKANSNTWSTDSDTLCLHTEKSTSRRNFFATSLLTLSTGGIFSLANPSLAEISWQPTPVNKRTGITVFDAEQTGYNVPFVTYLSRFLLTFDNDCQKWWFKIAASTIPKTATSDTIYELRQAQFAAFSASVEVGLQEFSGPDGPRKLMESLLRRYCSKEDGTATSSGTERRERIIREARRQICLLFGLMQVNQPVDLITQQLAIMDNGRIDSVQILDRGAGYAPGYGAPRVIFPPPDAGEGYETASGRAVLSASGRILRIDVVNRGRGYSKPPIINIAPPAAIRFGGENGEAAQAKAILFRSSTSGKEFNKGRIDRIELTNPGAGYSPKEIIRIRISSPELPVQAGGVTATATAVLEYEVSDIVILNNGTGYAVDKPVSVTVEPPPKTARINLNDPFVVATSKTDILDRVNTETSCSTGKFCSNDRAAAAIAYPKGSSGVYFSTAESDTFLSGNVDLPPPRVVSAAIAGELPPSLMTLAGGPASGEFLTLLPAGVGLEFNSMEKRYELSIDPAVVGETSLVKLSGRKIDPDFGPRGRSPIERDMQLGLSNYLRFILSGAICCSAVHLALTPIDVVKTKVQTDPDKYPGMVQSFRLVYQDDGFRGFFRGWVPTFSGFFVWGGLSYGLTEFVRRVVGESLGTAAAGLEVPIILFASAMGAFVGSFVISPFESVRIRTLSQPNYAPNIFGVLRRMIKEEGLFTLYNSIPAFLLKEIPFAMAKFTLYDVSTTWLYSQYPVAKEDLQLSLLVSLLGGTLGGIGAAIVSNPADVTISTLKKAKSDMTVQQAASLVLERGGPPALFTGLPIRMIFYALLISLQFFVYDFVRVALGIGSDDLTLYLDVLGGALSESGTALK